MRRAMVAGAFFALVGFIAIAPGAGAAQAETVRVEIRWDKPNDIDLHVRDDEGNEAWYADSTAIPDAALSSDVTDAGGPETFIDQRLPSTRHFTYRVCYYSEFGATGPTQVTVKLSDPGHPDRIGTVTLPEEKACADVGESLGEPEPVLPKKPVAGCDAYWVKPGGTLNVKARGILANDSDPQGLPLRVQVERINFGKKDHPYRINAATGAFTFSPGTRPFLAILNYRAVNSAGLASPPSSITVYVQPRPPAQRIGKSNRVSRCASGEEVPDSEVDYGPLRAAPTYTSRTPRSAQLTVQDVADFFAPQIRFDADESSWPMSVESFVANSSLRWKQECDRDKTLVDRKKGEVVVADKLAPGGRGNYSSRQASGRKCGDYGRPYGAHEFTRPYDTSLDRNGLSVKQGFHLDLLDSLHPGSRSGTLKGAVPIYYEYHHRADGKKWLRYYVMYACSAAPLRGQRDNCNHEGEWEGLSLLLDSSLAVEEVYVNSHHGGWRVDWWNVHWHGGHHPVVWAADGSHAGYPYKGHFKVGTSIGDGHIGFLAADNFPDIADDPADGSGPRWNTWRNVSNAAERPWFGFGGAWGRAGCLAGFKCKDRTGPLGPGPDRRVPAGGFPSPYMTVRGSFPSTAERVCDRGWYPDRCIRSVALGDLDCADVPFRDFKVTVKRILGNTRLQDPHTLDGNRNGVGCES